MARASDSTLSVTRAKKIRAVCRMQCPLMRKNASQGILFRFQLFQLLSASQHEKDKDHPAYSVYFAVDDVVAIKHARKREVFSFFLAVLLKDVLIKETPGNEFEFAKDTVDVLWLNNSDSDDSLAFTVAYRDCKNSPYTIVDKVAVVIEQDTSGKKLYSFSQEEADRIERRLQGGPDSVLESDVDNGTDDESDEERVPNYTLRPFSDSTDSVMSPVGYGV